MSRTTPHKEGKATVTVLYHTDKTLKDGSHPFVVRITKDRLRKYVSTGLSLHPDYWNANRNEIRRTYPADQKEELLTKLDEWEERYETAARELADQNIPHTADDVKNYVAEHRALANQGLVGYTRQCADNLRQSQQTGNAALYRQLANRLDAFLGNAPLPVPKRGEPPVDWKSLTGRKDVALSAVTLKFCNQFERWMRSQGLNENSMHNRFRTLRAVLNIAIAEGDLEYKYYPFARTVADRHKFSISKFSTDTDKRAISRADIAAIEAYTPAGTHTEKDGKHWRWSNHNEVVAQDLAQRVFLFSYYAAGINFVDLAQLRWKDISHDGATGEWRLKYTRQKTKGKFNIRLLPEAVELIAPYRPLRDHDRMQYVFPILDRHKHITISQINNRLKDVLDKRVNPTLKVIGQRLDIPDLTTYVARHSLATNLRMLGISNALISQVMGHATEGQTTVYLDEFSSPVVDAALEKLRTPDA